MLKRLLSLVTDHLKIMQCVFYNNSISELLTQKAKHPTHKTNSFFVSYLILDDYSFRFKVRPNCCDTCTTVENEMYFFFPTNYERFFLTF